MAAAGVLMQANIKFNGALILQVFGDGPVKLAVAEVQPDLAFRATAKVVGEVPADARLEAMLNVHGKGRCAITLDPQDKRAGAAAVPGRGAAARRPARAAAAAVEVLEHYMLQSEQLDTRLMLAADDEVRRGPADPAPAGRRRRATRGRRAATKTRSACNEDFNRIAHLAATLTREELLTLDADTVLRRLFWEEAAAPLRAAASRRVSPAAARASACAACCAAWAPKRCDGIVAERGEVEIGCEFCGLQYRFDAVDVGELFTPERDQPPGSVALQ